ncbi:MAG: hypothetical protein ACPLPS_02975 [bacterium]
MPIYSSKEVLRLKLSCMLLPHLRELCEKLNIETTAKAKDMINKITQYPLVEVENAIDEFIKEKYKEKVEKRRAIISDEELKRELAKVKEFSWGVIQGQLDQKIQTEYVRKFCRYEELLESVKQKLHHEISSYVICTWYNHWTTVLIEEHISSHPRVVPALKNVKGIDLFFSGQPFDLKVTYLPRGYDIVRAKDNPKELAKWMYEHQGEQRFGEENRFYVVLCNEKNPEESWKLKRDFPFVFKAIDDFLDRENVSRKDELEFTYKKKTYKSLAKILIISR